MKKAISLFISLTKNWLRSKSGMFFSVLFPVMLLIIFSAVFGGGEATEYTLHVQDEDGTDLSENFTDALDQARSLNVVKVENLTEHREEEAGVGSYRGLKIREGFEERVINKSMSIRADVMHNTMMFIGEEFYEEMDEDEWEDFEEGKKAFEEWSRYVGVQYLFNLNRTEYNLEKDLIESNVSEDLIIAFEENDIDLSEESQLFNETGTWWGVLDGENRYMINEVQNELEIYGERESANVIVFTSPGDQAGPVVQGTVRGIVDAFDSQSLGIDDTTIEVEDETTEERDLEGADYYLPGVLAAFIMTNGIIVVTINTTEFKRNGVLKRLSAAPLKKKDWIVANVIQQTLLAFLLTGIMILLSIILFDVQAYLDIYSIGLIFLSAVAFCSIGMILGGFIKDVEAASGIGNAIAFPMMFLSGVFAPIEQFPDYLQTVARALPLYYFHQGLQEIMILDNPSGALIPYLIMGILAIVFVIVAIKVTNWKDM